MVDLIDKSEEAELDDSLKKKQRENFEIRVCILLYSIKLIFVGVLKRF